MRKCSIFADSVGSRDLWISSWAQRSFSASQSRGKVALLAVLVIIKATRVARGGGWGPDRWREIERAGADRPICSLLNSHWSCSRFQVDFLSLIAPFWYQGRSLMDILPASKSSNPFAFYPSPHPQATPHPPYTATSSLSLAPQLSLSNWTSVLLLPLTSLSLLCVKTKSSSFPQPLLPSTLLHDVDDNCLYLILGLRQLFSGIWI